MKCFVPEISWHNRDPVYSLDIQPKIDDNESFYRLASGGADSHVVIWHVNLRPEDDSNQYASFECAADLQRHQKSVNVVRFSPNGAFLASGDDDGIIIIWKMRLDQDPPELPGDSSEKDKEIWTTYKVLRGHLQDVYDLAWSPDSTHLVSGSIDNTALLWDVEKSRKLGILGDHKGFVQGVSWDPKGKYIATLSTDRMLRVFDSSKRKLAGRCSKTKLPWASLKDKDKDSDKDKDKENKEEKEKQNKMFHNDTLKTFFRRLDFSPNGELLITPCGVIEEDGINKDATYIFTRGCFNKPAVHLPSPGQYTVAVRVCPIQFCLRGCNPALFNLPYRVVFAVATKSTLVLYDTEQSQPFGFVSNIHYTGLTDVTWSPDGRLIIISSSEGFCSVITFEENEIGIPYSKNLTKATNGTVIDKENNKSEEKPDENIKDSTEPMSIEQKEEKVDCSVQDNVAMDIGNDVVHNKGTNQKKEESMDVEVESKCKTPEKQPICTTPTTTPTKRQTSEKDEKIFKTPNKVVRTPSKPQTETTESTLEDYDSVCSDLSVIVEGEESDLISKEEQARRLMSPYRESPRAESPCKKTPQTAEGSPRTPKSGRRVPLITLSSPKTKRKL